MARKGGSAPAAAAVAPVATDVQAAYDATSRYLDTWSRSAGPAPKAPAFAAPTAPSLVAPKAPGLSAPVAPSVAAPVAAAPTAPALTAPVAPAVMVESIFDIKPIAAPEHTSSFGQPIAAPLPPTPPALQPAPPAAPAADEAPKADKAEAPAAEGKGPLLMKGHAGEPVKKLQERLKELGFDPGPADGIFGPQTDAAVRKFQEAKGLEVDGKVGPQTWKALGIVVTGQPERAPGVHREPGHAHTDGHTVDTPKGPMVGRQGKLISARIAENFDRMVAAAKADGVTLVINSAFRSHEEQVHLYNLYKSGKGNIAAKPGTSNHESGDAIDFANVGRAWSWLKANSEKYGFKNFDPEPWHYSPTGT